MSGLRPFVFLELPFEVREMIYELLLVHKDAHKSYTRNLLPYVYYLINPNRWMLRIVPKHTRSWQPDYNLHPAILRTNSHVHAEASRILYGKNYFVWSASQPHRGNESLIFKHTNRLHLEVPPYYLRLITRLLLIFDCGDPKSRGNPKTWSRAMELTVKETADTLKYNKLKELAVALHINIRVRLDYILRGGGFKEFAQDCNNIIMPLSRLRGVRKAIVQSLEMGHGPRGADGDPATKFLMAAIVRPRSEEEAARLAGWMAMGYRSSAPNYDILLNLELKSMLAKRGIPLKGARAKQQYIDKLREADAKAAVEKEREDQVCSGASGNSRKRDGAGEQDDSRR
jgi:hypothetical protein